MNQMNIAFLGVGHPHALRVPLLQAMPSVAICGFFEPDALVAERFADQTELALFARSGHGETPRCRRRCPHRR